jgi:alpha-N-arabinofuranosidase
MKPKFILALFLLFTFFISHSQVRIDIDKTQDPISEYIYGQFIEHLGNCIYNGLWAEMLEDRKFYYPVSDDFNPWGVSDDEYWNAGEYKFLKASPWQVIGPQNSVSMDSVNPYTGIHSVKVSLFENEETGIRQSGLSLLSGKTYKGRIILSGHKKADPVIIRLVYEDGVVLSNEIKKVTGDYTEYTLEFTAPESSDNVSIEIVSSGKGEFRIGTLSLMNADNISGWRKDVLALLMELNAPVYRWPGGNFVSGYNWRDGIGDRDKRPPRKNPAWKGVEHNDVGIHEYMELMDLINSEPFIAVNTGLGTVDEVAEEVEYCNGAADSPMGRLRASNGQEEPYGVKFWAVGNEMYGSWQLGNMPLEDYVKKHIQMAEAMWQSDPEIKLVGVGAVGEWSETMLENCSDHMDLISEHIYSKEASDLNKHINLLSNQIKDVANAHRNYRKNIKNLQAKDIRIAMDEWNYWYGDYIFFEM